MPSNLAKEIAAIHARNARVETDKAWETSKTRRGLIALATYLTMGVFLSLINAPSPWTNALVPAGAYVLSTLSLPYLKNWWAENNRRKNKTKGE